MKEEIREKITEFTTAMIWQPHNTFDTIKLNDSLSLSILKTYNSSNNETIYKIDILAYDDKIDDTIEIKKYRLQEAGLFWQIDEIVEDVLNIIGGIK